MLQEKAQDRERLLLKFIKIMKVTVASPKSRFLRPCPGRREAPGSLLLPLPSSPLASSLQHLRKLNNFNSYLAILSALDSAPIRRLEWQKQTSEVSSHDRPCSGQEQRPGPGSLLCHQPAGTGLRFPSLVSSHWALWDFVVGAGVFWLQHPAALLHCCRPSACAFRGAAWGWATLSTGVCGEQARHLTGHIPSE